MKDMTPLLIELPEDILKKKWAGDIQGALEAIDSRLKKDLPSVLRSRLLLEKEILPRMAEEYPYGKEKALAIMRGLVPDFTEAEFDALERDNAIDFLYVNGEKRYFVRFHRTLLKVNPDIAGRAGVPLSPVSPLLDEAMTKLKKNGCLKYRFRIRCSLRIDEKAFIKGETYKVHLPLPALSAQTGRVELLSSSFQPTHVSDPNHHQRTVYFEEAMSENKPFIIEYEFDVHMRYVDTGLPPALKEEVYPGCPDPGPKDLQELKPHISFTPYLKALAADLTAGETDPMKKARRIYDFVTTKVTYSFMRSYLTITGHAEYAAVNQRGDCGLQALLFITLCRIAGIPARWQSGLCIEPDSIGSHDWAQFYIAPFGWLFCDCSFGGAAWRKGNPARWNFYFGNLDPYRMVANDAYQAEFDPPKKHIRNDPYDNQTGECETDLRGLFDHEIHTKYEMISFEQL